jgi:hypothetical protein
MRCGMMPGPRRQKCGNCGTKCGNSVIQAESSRRRVGAAGLEGGDYCGSFHVPAWNARAASVRYPW